MGRKINPAGSYGERAPPGSGGGGPSPAEAGVGWRRRLPAALPAPRLRLRALGRRGGAQRARPAAAPSSHVPPPLLQPLHLPPRNPWLSSPQPAQWLRFPRSWQESRREIKIRGAVRGGVRGEPRAARPPQPAALGAGRGGEDAVPGGEGRVAPPRSWGAIPAPGCPPGGSRVASEPDWAGRGARIGGGGRLRAIVAVERFFLDAKGLIRVLLSREGLHGRGWCVRKANRSGYA